MPKNGFERMGHIYDLSPPVACERRWSDAKGTAHGVTHRCPNRVDAGALMPASRLT